MTESGPLDPGHTASSRRLRIVVALVLFVAALAAYGPSLRGPWLLDDVPLIERNPLLRSASDWPRLFVSDYWSSTGAPMALYRPLPLLSYAITRAITPHPFVFHLTNALLHGVNVVLAWLILMGGRVSAPAVIGSLIFALHPAPAEAVAGITGRPELLLCLGFLGALSFWRRLTTPSRSFASNAAGLVLCTAGMLFSKETGLFLGLYFLAEQFVRGCPDRRRCLAGTAALAAVGAFYLALRLKAVGLLPTGTEVASLHDHLVLSSSAIARYAGLLVWPSVHRAVWAWPDFATVGMAQVAAGLVIGAGCFAVAVYAVVRRRAALLPVTLLVLSAMPLIHIKPNIIWIWERGLYVPVLALGWLVCIGLGRLQGRTRAVALALASVALVACFARTASVASSYGDELVFWTSQFRENPSDASTALSLSEVLQKRGRADDAVALRERALRLDPDNGVIVTAVATTYHRLGRKEALKALLSSAADRDLKFKSDGQRGQTLRLLARLAEASGWQDLSDKYLAKARAKALFQPGSPMNNSTIPVGPIPRQ